MDELPAGAPRGVAGGRLLGPDALAFLQYTSGSTAEPKGVMVSHGNLLHNEEVIRRACGHDERSTFVSWLPMYHDMGLIGGVLQPLYVGASCALMAPVAFLQRPVRWLRAISRYRAHTSGAPDFAYDLCARKVTARADGPTSTSPAGGSPSTARSRCGRGRSPPSPRPSPRAASGRRRSFLATGSPRRR